MVCERMFISLLSLFVVRSLAYRIQTVSKSFWQADLTEEAKRLGKTNADIIVTCQTEATKGIHHFMAEEWQLVAHGEHWGAAGGSINAQMSSVFVRRPLDGSKLVGNVSEIIGRKPWRSDIGNHGGFGLVGSGVDSPLISALAQVTALDYKGKGGVSTTLEFHENHARPDFVLQFVCAHLDSETEEARHYGIAQMLAEARAPDLQTANALRKQAIGKSGEVREPCALYDSHFASCAAEALKLGPPPDAVLLFGDLNFRLSAQNIANISQVHFMDFQGRKILAKNDRLSHYDPYIEGEAKKYLDILVQFVGDKGFGFECNEPAELYPPTYKRKGGKVQLEKEIPFEKWETHLGAVMSEYSQLGYEVLNVTGDPWLGLDPVMGVKEQFPLKVKTYPHEACSTMGKAMLSCGGVMQPACKEWVLEMAEHCYVRKDKKGLHQWAQKKSDLQLGWLDRFCWRKTSVKGEIGVRLMSEEGWMDYPGAQEKDGSDHMPISGTFRFTTVRCSCFRDLHETHLFIPECRDQFGVPTQQAILGGDSYLAVCEPGYALRDGRHAMTLTCGKDGSLAPVTGEEMKCEKTCEWKEKNWRRFRRPPTLLAGDETRLTCKNNDDQLLGVPDIKCNKFGGLEPVDIQRIPVCVSVCKLLDQEDVVLKEKQLASSDLLAKYGDELKDNGALLRKVLLEGGTARYACRNGCVSVGNTERQCKGTQWTDAPVKCGCNIRLVIKEMKFKDPKLADMIEKVKFQAYGGPLTQEELEDLREHKGYKSSTKFTMEDLKSKKPNENLAIEIANPANTELHFTLCSKDHSIGGLGRRKSIFAFWRCGVLASTSTSDTLAVKVQQILRFQDSYVGEKTIEIPLDMKFGDQKHSRVEVKLQYYLAK